MQFDYDLVTLDNGIRIAFCDIPVFDSAYISVRVAGGRRLENKETVGTGHLLEHLLFCGSEKYQTEVEVNQRLRDVGISNNGFTAQGSCGYYIKGAKEDLAGMAELLTEIVYRPLFLESEIEKERKIVMNELNDVHDDHERYFSIRFFESLYADDHQYSFDHKEVLEKLQRDDFVKWHRENYTTDRSIVTVVGAVAESRQEIIDVFSAVEAEQSSPNKMAEEVVFSDRKLFVDFYDKEQLNIEMMVKNVHLSSDERRKLSFLYDCLVWGAESRLFVKCRREQQLIYGCGGNVTNMLTHDIPEFNVTVSKEYAGEFLKILVEQLRDLKENLIPEEEFAAVHKERLRYMRTTGESVNAIAQHVQADVILGAEKHIGQKAFDSYAALTREDVREIANKVFVEENFLFGVHGAIKEEEFAAMVDAALEK